MSSLQETGITPQIIRGSHLPSNHAVFNTQDIELGNSPLLSVPEIRRRPSPALSDLSLITQSVVLDTDQTDLEPATPHREHAPRGIKGRLRAFWQKNWALAFVCYAQFFGIAMGTCARLLEEDTPVRKGMHPFQILFVRMIISGVVATGYMWWTRTSEFPFGHRSVRAVLIVRGVAGFFGVGGMFLSLQVLPLSDAIVISFLAPPLACLACSYILMEPFTRAEQIATVISFLGVVLIAQPTAMFGPGAGTGIKPPEDGEAAPLGTTPQQRLLAVGYSLMGICGSACQIVCMRWVGTRAHPMITVNYLNFCVAVITGTLLSFLPNLTFAVPSTAADWLYISILSASGIILNGFLAAGLGAEKSSRATNMTYSAMLFAVVSDLVIWGTVPSVLSITGSSLILGSAVWVALRKDTLQGNAQSTKDVEYMELAEDEEQDVSN